MLQERGKNAGIRAVNPTGTVGIILLFLQKIYLLKYDQTEAELLRSFKTGIFSIALDGVNRFSRLYMLWKNK